jgi:ABC-type tungstate transport system permease subunit
MGTRSVKVMNIKQEAKELSKFTGEKINKKTYQNIVNDGNTMLRNRDKSGQSAKEVAQWLTSINKNTPKKPTVKINSNPTRSK